MPTIEGRDLPFAEAIGFFRQKLRIPTRTWTDIWQGMHARAFVVAGAMRDELLADFQEAVARGLEDGTTIAEFRKDFDRIVAKHGWSYKGGRGWRSRVIFDTNMRTAYMAGRWEQIQANAERRPFLRYVAVQDRRTRPDHRKWHGTVLRADDPWWSTHYPPNGWNCRCTVQQLSARDMERFGYTESGSAPPSPTETRTVNTPSGPVAVEVPEGIDPGWSYNVGEASVGSGGRGPQRQALDTHGPFRPLTAPGGSQPAAPGRLDAVAPAQPLGRRSNDEAALRGALRRALGRDQTVLTDPTGDRVAVGQAIVDHMLEDPRRLDGREAYFPLIPELVEDPAEIWVGFAVNEATGRVALRRRYVKLFRMDRQRVLGLIADADKGYWSGITVFRGTVRGMHALRQGLRIFGKE